MSTAASASNNPSQPAGKLTSLSHKGGFDWDLEIGFGLKNAPLIGEWRLKVVRDELGALKIAVHHGLAVGRLGSHVTVALGLYWCGPSGWEAIADCRWQGLQPGLNEVTGRSCVAWHITLKAADIDGASGAFKAAYERGGVMSLHLHLAISQAKSSSTVFEEATALRLPSTVASPLSNDVRLFFPRAGPGGAEIWTNATLLERSSPYFKDMLKSGFCESVQIGAKRPRVSPPVAEDVTLSEATKDVDDSDDETDDLLFQTNLPTLYDTSELPSFSYRQVVVKETAYSTYLAVLRYLETGFIRFAPLRSGASDDQSGSSSEADQGGSDARDGASSTDSRVGLSSRAQVVTDAIEEHPDLPAPVSPKSTYRLAHLLKLTRLQRMCCEALRKQRTPPLAAHELFDQAAVLYDDWRKVILDYVAARWDVVSASPSWKETMERVKANEVDGAAGIMVELMQAVLQAQRAAEP